MKQNHNLVASTFFLVIISWCLSLHTAGALDLAQLRLKAAKQNATCILVFGDSSVDPGNNNRLKTQSKSNFPPYGKDFFNGQPTGRFCNGRLVPDFMAEAFGKTNAIKAFLDPNLTKIELVNGVSFASAGSGYDDLTANLSDVISITKQLEYLRHYKIHLRSLVGEERSQEIIRNAIYILSMGDNDFLLNYYTEPTRAAQYSIEQYQDYLISRMLSVIKNVQSMGARKILVAGVAPFGCMPFVRLIRDAARCDVQLNNVAFSYNTKVKNLVNAQNEANSSKVLYVDIYSPLLDAVENPRKYGFVEPAKGCCGSGMYEFANACKNQSTCLDRTKYVFWDALHPTEKMYEIIADQVLQLLANTWFS